MKTFNVHKMFIFQSSSVLSVPGSVPCVLCIYFLLKSRSDLSNTETCVLCDLLGCICPSVLLADGLGSAAIPVSAVSVPVSDASVLTAGGMTAGGMTAGGIGLYTSSLFSSAWLNSCRVFSGLIFDASQYVVLPLLSLQHRWLSPLCVSRCKCVAHMVSVLSSCCLS